MINIAELFASRARMAREVVVMDEQAQKQEAESADQGDAQPARGSGYPAKQLVLQNGSYVAVDPGK